MNMIRLAKKQVTVSESWPSMPLPEATESYISSSCTVATGGPLPFPRNMSEYHLLKEMWDFFKLNMLGNVLYCWANPRPQKYFYGSVLRNVFPGHQGKVKDCDVHHMQCVKARQKWKDLGGSPHWFHHHRIMSESRLSIPQPKPYSLN